MVRGLCEPCPNPLKEKIKRGAGVWECRKNIETQPLTEVDLIPLESKCAFQCKNSSHLFEFMDQWLTSFIMECKISGVWESAIETSVGIVVENIRDFNNICPIGGCDVSSLEEALRAELTCDTKANVIKEDFVPHETNCMLECDDPSVRLEITKYQNITCLKCSDPKQVVTIIDDN